MFFFGGLGHRIHSCGTAEPTFCSKCSQSVPFAISKSYSYVHAFLIPVWKYQITYLATCTHCGATMELSPMKGKTFEKTGHIVVCPEDLAGMSHAFSYPPLPSCTRCGTKLSPTDRFCPQCGSSLSAQQ